MRFFQVFLSGLVIISVGAAIHVAIERIGWEGRYRTVTIAVDYRDLVRQGAPDEKLAELARQGIAAIVLDPVELDRVRTEELRQLGLEPLLLLDELYRYAVGDLKDYLAQLAQLKPRLIVFQDEGKADYSPGQLEEIEEVLQATAPLVGIMEFDSGTVEGLLHQRGFKRFIRAHTIEPEELQKMGEEEALSRFRRAVRERNIRLILVRLFEASLNYNLIFLKGLNSLLQADGFRLGIPRAVPQFRVGKATLALILLGPLSLGLWGLNRAWRLRLSSNLTLLLLGSSVIVAGLHLASGPFELIVACGTAILAPVAAYLLLAPAFERARGSAGQGLAAVLAFSSAALLGGLWVGTILSGEDFFLKLAQFRGVKAALILPLLLVAPLHYARHGLSGLRDLLSRRPSFGELLLLLLGAAAILLVLLRSDNFSAVPRLERQAREAMESLLYARPRFKEFLIGHPLLLLWGAYGERLGHYRVIFLSLGTIGPVSIINSFAHLHTPLPLSLLRTANGVILGLVMGLVILWLARWGERLWQRSGS